MIKFFIKKYNALRLLRSRFKFPKGIQKVIQSRINDYELLVFANEDVGRWINVLGEYERRDSDYLSQHLLDNDICIDVGANTGYFTMLMAKLSHKGQVHAFEPVVLNYHLLCSSVQLNKYPNVLANNCAVGEENGEIDFSISEDGAYSSMIPTGRRREKNVIKTNVISLDNYFKHKNLPKIDILKVDVEGAEGLVIKGARSVLAHHKTQPRLIIMELQDMNLKAYGSSINEIIMLMREFGYSSFYIDEELRAQPFLSINYNVVCNVFFSINEKSSVKN
jgi:FkbM family methyltransferase